MVGREHLCPWQAPASQQPLGSSLHYLRCAHGLLVTVPRAQSSRSRQVLGDQRELSTHVQSPGKPHNALNHLIGATHSFLPTGLGLGHGGRGRSALQRLDQDSWALAVGDMTYGPLVPDFWGVSVPGPLTWPRFAHGPSPSSLMVLGRHTKGRQCRARCWGLGGVRGCQQLTWLPSRPSPLVLARFGDTRQGPTQP